MSVIVKEKNNFPGYFLSNVGRPLQKSILLKEYSNFKIGGQADFFFEAFSVKELLLSIKCARDYSIRFYLIGGGFNILFDDKGFRGLIIKNSVQEIKHIKDSCMIETSSGIHIDDLVKSSQKAGLGGFEFLAGIPGTVGGAIFSNAGAFNQAIGNFLKSAEILDEHNIRVEVDRDFFSFSYRYSFLKEEHCVLLKAIFELHKTDKKIIVSRIQKNLKVRKNKHPSEDIPCAGSYFKNCITEKGEMIPAAYFLDKIGAKKLKIGGAAVYSGHANFIININDASARDVLSLAEELKKRVKEKFHIDLEEEVIFLPEA
jgi:UDP-N-acetylmuramate dehydrogenase